MPYDNYGQIIFSEKLEDDSFKEWHLDLVEVFFPSGQNGYRFEYLDEDAPFPEDLGTLTIIKGKLVVVNW
jgi:hypothetical protein